MGLVSYICAKAGASCPAACALLWRDVGVNVGLASSCVLLVHFVAVCYGGRRYDPIVRGHASSIMFAT